jgi:hypothetical protein
MTPLFGQANQKPGLFRDEPLRSVSPLFGHTRFATALGALRRVRLWSNTRTAVIIWRMDEQRRLDPVAPGGYLSALGDRLTADGCETDWAEWEETQVLVGRRSDKKVRWFGTRVHLFTVAASVPEVSAAVLSDFTGWALHYAKQNKGAGLPVSYGNVLTVFPVLVGGTVQTAAKDWARENMRLMELAVAGRPVVVDTGAGDVTFYRGKPLHGRMFVKHTLEKADLYFP